MPINLWSIESQIYPSIDAAGMKSEYIVELKDALGNEHNVSFKAQTFDKRPIGLHDSIGSKYIGFSLNFWIRGELPWLRVDNDHGFLHQHLASGSVPFNDHQALPEMVTLSGCISQIFILARKTIEWKFPGLIIYEGNGFVGSR